MSKRRIIPSRKDIDPLDEKEAIQTALRESKLEDEELESLSDIEELEWQIAIGKKALAKYRRSMKIRELNLDEERMVLAMQDSLRKLRMSLAALKEKQDHSDLKNHEIAALLYKTGMSKEALEEMYEGDKEVARTLERL